MPFSAPFGPPPPYPRGDPVAAPASPVNDPANASGQRLIPTSLSGRNRRAHFYPPDSDDDSLFHEVIHGVKRASDKKPRTTPTP